MRGSLSLGLSSTQNTNTDLLLAAQSSVKNVFIRGSVVRYVHLPASGVDIPLLEDATRRGESPSSPFLLCFGGGLVGWVMG